MAEIWFSSDLHLYHNKPFVYEPRGFINEKEMTEGIIANFNEVIKPEDTLYLLGDNFLTCDLGDGLDAIKRIKCDDIRLIFGNHDSPVRLAAMQDCWNVKAFLGYADIIKDGKKIYYLSHYPTQTANYDDNWHSAIRNLHGHTHQKNPSSGVFRLNVGVDAWNCRPVSFGEVKSKIREIYESENG